MPLELHGFSPGSGAELGSAGASPGSLEPLHGHLLVWWARDHRPPPGLPLTAPQAGFYLIPGPDALGASVFRNSSFICELARLVSGILLRCGQESSGTFKRSSWERRNVYGGPSRTSSRVSADVWRLFCQRRPSLTKDLPPAPRPTRGEFCCNFPCFCFHTRI